MENIEIHLDDRVAVVTFCRPPVNALTRQVLANLSEVFDSFRHDRAVSAVVFRVCPGRAFIAGVDLKEADQPPEETSPAALIDRGAIARQAFDAIYNCAVPVVAAVDGAVIGGGVCIVSCCDIIVASNRSTFGLTEINVGLLGASAHLSRLVGRYRAREMFLTGRLADAAELAQFGAVAQVVAPEEVLATAMGYAGSLAAKSPLALRLAKESLNRTDYLPFDEAYRIEQDYTSRLLQLADSGEARQAFLEKREPRWNWR